MTEIRMRKYGCIDCGNEIPATEKYCKKCKEVKKTMTTCRNCNKNFVFKNSKNSYSTGYYCDGCLHKKEELKLEMGNCLICDKEFYKKSENHKYCSDGCRDTVKTMTESDRFVIFERDEFKCMYCGNSSVTGATLVIDHIFPYSKGGEHTADNLVTACYDCNVAKSNKIMSNRNIKRISDYVAKANIENNIHPKRFIKGSHTKR